MGLHTVLILIMCNPVSKRILAVFGTETGSTKSEAQEIVESWKSSHNLKGAGSVTLLEGNEAADQFDTIKKENYDIIVVITSSYGDGDAPSGFGKFLYKIYAAAADVKKRGKEAAVLAGMEHSVLGFGSTVYYTFQNVPRLCDRLLEESGSTRFLMRSEVDEMGDFDENKNKIKEWSDAVVKHAKETGRDPIPAPVCKWTSPESEIYEKKLGPDGYEIGSGPGDSSSFLALLLAVAIGGFAYYYYRFQNQETDQQSLVAQISNLFQ